VWRVVVLLALAYGAFTVWWLWPLSAHPGSAAGNLAGRPRAYLPDFNLTIWALAWDAHALATHPWRLFDANAFYPARLSLAFSEHFLGYLPFFAPVWAATGNPVLAGNLVLFATFPLSALGMFAAARRWTGAPAAAVAGFLYAFDVHRLHTIPLFHMLGVWWLPLVVLLLDRWLDTARTRDAVLLAIALVFQALSSFYLAYVLAIVVGVQLAAAFVRDRGRWDRRRVVGLGAVFLVAGGILVAVSLPYLELRRIGLILDYGAAGEPLPIGLAFGAFMTLTYLQNGVGLVGYGLGVLALLPPWRGRGWPVVLGLLLAVVGTLLACGPILPLFGRTIPTPYGLLMEWVPGFASIRVSARLAIAAHLGFCLLAALGVERVLRLAPGRAHWLLAVLLCAGALGAYGRLPVIHLDREETGDAVPGAYRWLAEHGEGRPLLELPQLGQQTMYYSIYHWLPIVGGYSAYPPSSAEYVHEIALGLPDEDALQRLVDTIDVGWVLVHGAWLSPEQNARLAGPLPDGLERVGEWGSDLLLRVTRPVVDDRRATLTDTRETPGGVPLAAIGPACPGSLQVTTPVPWHAATAGTVQVVVRNDGTRPWPGFGFVPRHLVRVRACFALPGGGCFAHGWPLPADVPAGGSITASFDVPAPPIPGLFDLRVDLMQTGDGPLARCGVEPVAHPVQVVAP
jgi:hypothetical protein